ncbi:reverse transcriptase domain-containing protein [Trichonephila clavipes]|nr:reverse transcriptase domain-containing protein [Trichonephila clavipes]
MVESSPASRHPEQFTDPSITSSDELYMLELKKQSDISLTSILDFNFEVSESPNFGGLWEAGVKSFKRHFKRTVGDARLTLEQFITNYYSNRKYLNSRPLTPMSSDLNYFAVLTPGHFLINRPLQSLPEPDMTDKLDNRLSQ